MAEKLGVAAVVPGGGVEVGLYSAGRREFFEYMRRAMVQYHSGSRKTTLGGM